MEQNGNPQLIQALMSRLSQPGTMKERFRLPFDEDTATALLRSAVEGEICRFGGTFLCSDAVEAQIKSLAKPDFRQEVRCDAVRIVRQWQDYCDEGVPTPAQCGQDTGQLP